MFARLTLGLQRPYRVGDVEVERVDRDRVPAGASRQIPGNRTIEHCALSVVDDLRVRVAVGVRILAPVVHCARGAVVVAELDHHEVARGDGVDDAREAALVRERARGATADGVVRDRNGKVLSEERAPACRVFSKSKDVRAERVSREPAVPVPLPPPVLAIVESPARNTFAASACCVNAVSAARARVVKRREGMVVRLILRVGSSPQGRTDLYIGRRLVWQACAPSERGGTRTRSCVRKIHDHGPAVTPIPAVRSCSPGTARDTSITACSCFQEVPSLWCTHEFRASERPWWNQSATWNHETATRGIYARWRARHWTMLAHAAAQVHFLATKK